MNEERYRLFKKSNGIYAFYDKLTEQRESTGTRDQRKANKLLFAKNQAAEQPALNLEMAKTYAKAVSPELASRTWKDAMEDITLDYQKTDAEISTIKRWNRVCESQPFSLLKNRRLIDTQAEHFLAVLRHKKAGTSTNNWLRKLHNYALKMGWLLAPVLAQGTWPVIRSGEKRGITKEEHQRIIAAENNEERRLFYELLWETGGSQSDIATLTDDRIDWEEETLMYRRAKTKKRGYEFAKMRIGPKMKQILKQLPSRGFLFPNIARIKQKHRSTEFGRRRNLLGIKGVTLHSYRYGWAERARKADVPIRASMEVLGHQSKAVHQAYAKKVEVDLMPLEYYEKKKQEKIIELKKYQQNHAETNPEAKAS